MVNKYKYLAKNTIIFAIGNIGSKIILFFLVPLYTAYMTTDQYGTGDLVFTMAQLIMPFVTIVIYDAVIRFGLSKYEKSEDVLLVAIDVLCIGSLITIALTPLFSLYKAISEWKWELAMYVILSGFYSTNMNYLKVKEKNLSYTIISLLDTGLMAFLNILFLAVFHWGIKGYLYAYIISLLVCDILSFIVFNGVGELRKAHFEKALFRKMLAYSAPLIFNNISWWVIHSSDKVMIQAMLNNSELGLYTVSAKIPAFINVLITIFSEAWGISSVKEFENSNDTEFYSNILKIYTFICFGASIFLIAICKPFMKIYVSNSFFESWKYVPFLLAAAAFNAISAYYGSLYGALKKSTRNMLTTLLAAVINIVINYIGINIVGTYGAAIGTLAAYFVIAIVRMIDVGHFIDIKFDILKFSIMCVLIGVQSIFVTLDFHPAIVSIVVIAVFAILNRDNFKMLMLRVKKN